MQPAIDLNCELFLPAANSHQCECKVATVIYVCTSSLPLFRWRITGCVIVDFLGGSHYYTDLLLENLQILNTKT
jgi:hypothetical protein